MRTKVYGKRGKGMLGGRNDPFGQDSPKLIASDEKIGTREVLQPLLEKTGNTARAPRCAIRVGSTEKKHREGKEECMVKPAEHTATKCCVVAPKGLKSFKAKKDSFHSHGPPLDSEKEVVNTPPLPCTNAPLARDPSEQSTKLSQQSQTIQNIYGSRARSTDGCRDQKIQRSRPRRPANVEDICTLLQNNLVVSENKISENTNRLSTTRSQRNVVPAIPEQPALLDANTKSYITPLLRCNNVSQRVEIFQAWLDERVPFLDLRKIGEGSFGEVYRATSGNGDTVIMKIIPLDARKGRGSRSFTTVEAASNEVQLLERMQQVPGFVEFRGACVLRGSMPWQLVQQWDEYKAEGRTVESRDPHKKTSYPDDQLWLLVEMSDAGMNLEPGHYQPPILQGRTHRQRRLSLQRTWDIFWQIVRALAKAEVYNEFEHRDLHLGNICASDTRSQHEEEDLTLIPRETATPFSLDNTGIQVTIIDYSLSRALVDTDRVLCYDFMKNDSLLTGEGELQYDIYRHMAEALGSQRCGEFEPKTNVLWLSYLLTKLLEATIELSDEARVERDGCITVTAKMRIILDQVRDTITLERRHAWPVTSAGGLLEFGTEHRWYSVEESLGI